MEKKHLYIVSFGDSDKYRFDYESPASADDLHKPSPFLHIEKLLESWLEQQLPGHSFPDLSSAKATEVECSHRDRYAGYPPLDNTAIEAIKRILLTEARNRLDQERLDLNAPFSTTA